MLLDLPFNYVLTPNCIKNMGIIFEWTFLGINLDNNRYNILSKLQEYDFISKLVSKI
jgi:hypothetical protein